MITKLARKLHATEQVMHSGLGTFGAKLAHPITVTKVTNWVLFELIMKVWISKKKRRTGGDGGAAAEKEEEEYDIRNNSPGQHLDGNLPRERSPQEDCL